MKRKKWKLLVNDCINYVSNATARMTDAEYVEAMEVLSEHFDANAYAKSKELEPKDGA